MPSKVVQAERSQLHSPRVSRAPSPQPGDIFSGLLSIAADEDTCTTPPRRLSATELTHALNAPRAMRSSVGAAAANFALTLTPAERRHADALAGEPESPPERTFAVRPSRRGSINLATGVAMALETLGIRALSVGAKNVEVDASTRVISFNLPSMLGVRHEVGFELVERFSATSPEVAFFGLRVLPRRGSVVHRTLAAEARMTFASAIQAIDNATGEPKRPVAIFDSDATVHLSREELIRIFVANGYEGDWSKCKLTSRHDATRSPDITLLEERISAQCGHAFRHPDARIGTAKMWCINDLRRAYFYEPLQERAALGFAEAINQDLNDGDHAHLYHVESCTEVGPDAYDLRFAPLVSSGDDDRVLVEVRYRAPGSRKAASDIDCTVSIRPDHYLDAIFHRVVHGRSTEAGLIAKHLAEMGIPKADFDVNFYAEGFLHDASMPDLASPFHVTTPEGLAVKQELDRGAAMKNLLRSVPGAAEAYASVARADRGGSSVMALDYAFLREVKNGCDLMRKALDILSKCEAVPPQVTEAMAPFKSLSIAVTGSPLTSMRGGAMSLAARNTAAHMAGRVRSFREALDAIDFTIHNVRFAIRVQEDLISDYEEELSMVKQSRDAVLQEILAYESGSAEDPERHHDLRRHLEYFSLCAVDLQVAITSESNEAYASLSAIRLSVEEGQQHIEQIPNASVASVAILNQAAMLASHRLEDVLRNSGVNPAQASPEDLQAAFVAFAGEAAKYIERGIKDLKRIMPRHPSPTFPVGRVTRTSAEVLTFYETIKAAREALDEAATHAAIVEFGMPTTADMVQFLIDLSLYAQARSGVEEGQVQKTKDHHRAAMRELEQLDSFLPDA